MTPILTYGTQHYNFFNKPRYQQVRLKVSSHTTVLTMLDEEEHTLAEQIVKKWDFPVLFSGHNPFGSLLISQLLGHRNDLLKTNSFAIVLR
jgi:hypothetical protein